MAVVRNLTPLLAGLLVVFTSAVCAALQVELVAIPIDPAIAAVYPSLGNAQTWQLQVTSDNDLLFMELHLRAAGGEMFQVAPPLGRDDAPANPVLLIINPALAYDSYTRVPQEAGPPNQPPGWDYGDQYSGPTGITSTELHVWRDDPSNLPGLSSFPVAQVTYLLEEAPLEQQWIARFFERSPGGEVVEHFYATPGLTSPFGADATLDLRVDGDDLAVWSAEFGESAELPLSFAAYDIDHDGDTDEWDVSTQLIHLGATNATQEQGDVDGNHIVSVDDYKLLRQLHYGHRWSLADFDQNLLVDGSDFLAWQRAAGGGFPQAATALASAVPEPAAAGLVATIVTAAGLRRRAIGLAGARPR
jgi:hypothetical protein